MNDNNPLHQTRNQKLYLLLCAIIITGLAISCLIHTNNKSYVEASPVGNAAWPTVHGDNQNSSHSTHVVSSNLKKQWEISIGAQNLYSPTIGIDGTVYVAGRRTIVALDPRTGMIKWRYTSTDDIQFSPIVDDNNGLVFDEDYHTHVFALNRKTGLKQWFTQVVPGFQGDWEAPPIPLMVTDNRVLIGFPDMPVLAELYAETGHTVPSFKTVINGKPAFAYTQIPLGGFNATNAIVNGRPAADRNGNLCVPVFMATTSPYTLRYLLCSFDKDGRPLWRSVIDTQDCAVALSAQDNVVATTFSEMGTKGFLYCINSISGRAIWTRSINFVDPDLPYPVIGTQDHIYLAQDLPSLEGNNVVIWCYSEKNGQTLWHSNEYHEVSQPVSDGANNVIAICDRNLTVLSGETGAIQQQVPLGSSPNRSADGEAAIGSSGTVYVSVGNKVMAFGR